jgi:hypothetical protein
MIMELSFMVTASNYTMVSLLIRGRGGRDETSSMEYKYATRLATLSEKQAHLTS